MKKHKLRTPLALAITLGLGMAAASSSALAVQLDNNDGLGDAGIFQYYTVNGGWQTFVRVINTSDKAVSVKFRFREAANSREVLDFTVFLSPYDVWSGWTSANAIGNGLPGVKTKDTSCLYPLPDSNNTDEGWKTLSATTLGAEFQDRAFTGVYDDNGGLDSVVRMSEGHLEVIGIAEHSPVSPFGLAVTHNQSTGKPTNCSEASTLFKAQAGGARGSDLPNVLGMNGYVINVDLGQGGGFDPDILTDFVDSSLSEDALATATDPDMDSADADVTPDDSSWQKQKGYEGTTYVTGGVDAVSYELQRSAVKNEWAASSNPEAAVSDYYTQWVLTFPTKHYYVDLQTDMVPGDDVSPTLMDPTFNYNDAKRPFNEEFDWAGGESCEPYRMRIWNREESISDFTSPEPIFPIELCYETNVLVFNEGYLDEGLNSNFSTTITSELLPVDVGGVTSERGWASMDFYADGGIQGLDPKLVNNRYLDGRYGNRYGLPVTGWMLSVFNTNDNATNHTTINSHKYSRED